MSQLPYQPIPEPDSEGNVPLSRSYLNRIARATPTFSGADLIDKTRTRKKRSAVLMQRNGHHIVTVIKSLLDPVAVMNIDIKVKHPFAGIGKSHDPQHHVVDITKTRGIVFSRVMKSARRVKSNLSFAGNDVLGGCKRRACRPYGMIENPFKYRTVAGPQAHIKKLRLIVPLRCTFQRIQKPAGMIPPKTFSVRGFRFDLLSVRPR